MNWIKYQTEVLLYIDISDNPEIIIFIYMLYILYNYVTVSLTNNYDMYCVSTPDLYKMNIKCLQFHYN